jgi:hypothetical protein
MARIDIRNAFSCAPAPLDFVLPGLLTGTVGTLFSPGATGKSFLLLEAAMGIACSVAGGDLLGLRAGLSSGRRVAYMAAEDTVPVLEHRIHAIGQHLQPEAREVIADALDIECMVGRRFNIMDDRHLRALAEFAAGARLLVIDTISRVHQLDENSASDMARLLGNLEFVAGEAGAAVVFAQHVAKSAARDGQGDQQHAARGSSVLTDNARWGAALTRMTATESMDYSDDPIGLRPVGAAARGWYVRMSIPKNNYSGPIDDRWYRREDGGVLRPVNLIRIKGDGKVSATRAIPYQQAKDGQSPALAGGRGDWE